MTALYIFLWYSGLSILLGLVLAIAMVIEEKFRKHLPGHVNKLGLGLVIAAVIGCPVFNVIAIAWIIYHNYWRKQ